ncbi:glycerate kinase [Larsenimonas rhizosphaerae]|uniref:glycerate kinase n=1 Tax=Larsenimonas rhizosphaerae TaxID=2944682 RepID=UPI0020339D47|nr:glycerate kinase [Larsenimonas rhizosphaerae]MCM2129822.1 glycerate kinase [Larsenimonas rhizosphaerae]
MIILAPDSFKDALSARDAAQAMASGIRRVQPEATLLCCPMGDGGEGTLDAIIAATGIERRITTVVDALGRPIDAAWGWNEAEQTAIVELAEAAGLQQIAPDERDARHTTTEGVGLLIKAALDAGARHLVLTLGGSATNDAGSGMMRALGLELLDDAGTPLPPGGSALARLARVNTDHLDPRLEKLTVQAAVDVNNPLCGPQGASAVFGPQKGADADTVAELDKALAHFAEQLGPFNGPDHANTEGAGAAGGMGFAALAFLNATLVPGIELVMAQVNFDEALSDASLVITGEGRVDGQSLSGKTPIGIARRARDAGVPVVVLAGSLGEGWTAIHDEGVTATWALSDRPMALEEALARCAELLADRSEAVWRLWQQAARGQNRQ